MSGEGAFIVGSMRLMGNIVIAAAKASPRMVWMSLASPSMDASTHRESSEFPEGRLSGWCAREASNEWPMAIASDMAAWESSATLDFHPSSVGSGIGYRKRGTLGDLVDGRDKACWGGIGRCRVPMTPWWSQKAAWAVIVSSVWREMRLGSHKLRWSIHDF